MTKRELIDEIARLNPGATPAFLAHFDAADLAEYLEHLRWVRPPKAGPAAEEDGALQPEAAEDREVQVLC